MQHFSVQKVNSYAYTWNVRAAIYTRISADTAGRGLGVARQLDDCKQLAAKLGWTVSKAFDDNDISAYSGKRRPGFEAMLEAMKEGEIDALLCWHTDRLYRNMKDLERVIEIADANRIEIRSVQGGTLDLSTSAGRMVARILGSVARQESEHGSERRKRANAQKAASGVWSTTRRPFGYTQDGQPLEPEASAVRQAVVDVLAGKSIRQLAREWNGQGLRTTGTADAWRSTMISRLLINPRYAALVVHQGKVVGKGAWTPLIDEDTHHGLVAYLKDPSRNVGRGFERKYQGSGVYRCGVCGGTLSVWHPASKKIRAYVCKENTHVRRQGITLDEYVDALVIGRLKQPDAVKLSAALDSSAGVDVVEIHTKKSALQARLDDLAGLFAEGSINASQLKRGTVELSAAVESLDAELAAATQGNPVAGFLGTADGSQLERRWQELSPDIRGKIINQLMTVTVNKAPQGLRRFDPAYVEVVWQGGSEN